MAMTCFPVNVIQVCVRVSFRVVGEGGWQGDVMFGIREIILLAYNFFVWKLAEGETQLPGFLSMCVCVCVCVCVREKERKGESERGRWEEAQGILG